MKRIILDILSISLFKSFNVGNEKSIFFFRSLNERECIRFSDIFTKIPKTPLYIQHFILKCEYNNTFVIDDSTPFLLISLLKRIYLGYNKWEYNKSFF